MSGTYVGPRNVKRKYGKCPRGVPDPEILKPFFEADPVLQRLLRSKVKVREVADGWIARHKAKIDALWEKIWALRRKAPQDDRINAAIVKRKKYIASREEANCLRQKRLEYRSQIVGKLPHN